MLMNVFVTTFGISGGVHGSVFGGGAPVVQVHSSAGSSTADGVLLPQSMASTSSTTLAAATAPLNANITSTSPTGN